jgi:selenocysteine lyase/cysteine desulfurase
MEHHSNMLPWRRHHNTIHIDVNQEGKLNLDELEIHLKLYRGKVKLVTISGGSNVTGYIPPIYQIAELVHEYNALIAVDAAQLAPHRKIQMRSPNKDDSIDFIAISASVVAPLSS